MEFFGQFRAHEPVGRFADRGVRTGPEQQSGPATHPKNGLTQ